MGDADVERGQSSVLGIVLLFAIVITVSMSVVVVGSGALADARSSVVDQSAVTSMGELQSATASVEPGGGSRQVSFADSDAGVGAAVGDGGVTTVDESSGTITVSVTDADSGATETITRNVGAVTYEGDSERLVYQAGGVFRVGPDGESGTVVSPPNVQYQYRNGAPTLRLSITELAVDGPNTRGSFDDGVELRQAEPSTRRFPTGGFENPLEHGDSIEITVESVAYPVWADFFEQRTGGTVTTGDFDGDGQQAARVTLEGPPDVSPTAPGALVTTNIPQLSVSNHALIDSYDSSTTPVSPGGGTNAPVYVDGSYDPNNHVQIDGDLVVAEHATFDSNDNAPPRAHIEGKTITGGTPGSGSKTKVNGNTQFKGLFSTTDDLFVEGKNHNPGKRARFEDDVYVGGGVTNFRDVRVEGDMYVQGDIELGDDSHITGDLVAGGEITEAGGADVTVEGARDENANPPSPRSPNLPTLGSVAGEITATKDSVDDGDNDNPGDGTIDEIESYNNCDPCTLTGSAGGNEYYIPDGINLYDSETLIFDTSSGPITVYAGPNAGGTSLYLNDGSIEVHGDNPVRIYNGGGFEMTGDTEVVTKDATGTTETYRSQNFQVFVKPSETVNFNGQPSFTGVVHGPGGTDITLTNHVEIYGAIIGEATDVSNHATIHFDEALLDSPPRAPGGNGDDGRVAYLTVETREVTVEDD
ncbi:DUF7289 family protein [Halomicrobium mukohataei]|nr:hypothetical protein [Halomicrobium mukohataei]